MNISAMFLCSMKKINLQERNLEDLDPDSFFSISIRYLWKVSGTYGKYPVHIYGKYPVHIESIRYIWKVSGTY